MIYNDHAIVCKLLHFDSDKLVIPDTVMGVPVTTIDNKAVNGWSGITSIVIPDTVSYIGKGAFESCKDLESVYLGNGLKTIDASAFRNCTHLKSVTIPKSVSIIGNGAFDGGTSLETIKVLNFECDIKALPSEKNESEAYHTLGDPSKTTILGFGDSTA